MATILEQNNVQIVKIIQKHNKDYMRVYSGYEGDGKTLLACSHALQFNPDFDVKSQAIYSLEQMLDFQDIYEGTPGKVAFLDEAVLQLLGEDSNTKDSKNSKKLFVTHRDRGHIYLLCSPSPWLLTPYIREWRVRDCVLIYSDQFSANLDRRYAYYSKHEYAAFITTIKAKKQIVVPADFVKRYKPAFDESFPMVTDENVLKIYKEMAVKKKDTQRTLREDIRADMIGDKTPQPTINESSKDVRDMYMTRMAKLGYKKKDVARVFDVNERTVYRLQNMVA